MEIVQELMEEEKSVDQTSSEYGIHPNQIYRWIKQRMAQDHKAIEDGRRGTGALSRISNRD